jgi:hypothetical protein
MADDDDDVHKIEKTIDRICLPTFSLPRCIRKTGESLSREIMTMYNTDRDRWT